MDLKLPDTGVPVELDRIYASLRDLSEALGPNGVNKDGTLNHLLEAGAHALDGQGQRGNEMIRQLSEAAATFGQGAGPLFDTVEELARFTDTLATNDKLVRAFVEVDVINPYVVGSFLLFYAAGRLAAPRAVHLYGMAVARRLSRPGHAA